jgi:hypothetical protein
MLTERETKLAEQAQAEQDAEVGYLAALQEDTLVAMWAGWGADLERIGHLRWEVEKELEARMVHDRATERVVGDYVVEFKPTVEWDHEAFRPLLEVEDIPPEALAKAYMAAHTQTVEVPEKWNATQVKVLRKYGGKALQIIEAAQREGLAKLRIKPRDK